jgi:osmotically-inducible protein OsmY
MSSPTVRSAVVRFPEIAEAANERLRNSPYRALRAISCEYDQGVLLLRGHVPSFYQKQLAQEAVAAVSGVIEVVNRIEVG